MSIFLSALLKPFVLLAVLGFLLCIRYAVIWWWPEGKVKRFLLQRVGDTDQRRGHVRQATVERSSALPRHRRLQ